MTEKVDLIKQLQTMFGDRLSGVQKLKFDDVLSRLQEGAATTFTNHTNPADVEALKQDMFRLAQELKYFMASNRAGYLKLKPHAEYIMAQVSKLKQQGNLDMARVLMAGLLSQLKAGTIVPKEVYNPTEI
jgi:hypothetical protein